MAHSVTFLLLIFSMQIAIIFPQTTPTPSANITTAGINVTESSTAADNMTTSVAAETTTSQSTTTTTDSNSTTTANIPADEVVPDTPNINPSFELNVDIPFCTCDLTAGFCDINCCCDRSCTIADREAFTSCDEVLQSFTDSPVCLPVNSIFLNNAPYKCELVDSQCCLQKTDTSAQNYFDPPAVINNAAVFDTYKSKYGSYSYVSTSAADDQSMSEGTNYRSGNYIGTLNTANVKGIFMVPGIQPSSGECLDRTPAKFLQDTSVTCWRKFKLPLSSLCATTGYLNASGYTGLRFMDSPYLSAETEISVNSLVGVEAVGESRANLHPSNNTCYNIVTKVEYIITHNAGVLRAVNVSITTDTFSGDVLSLNQAFMVTYQDNNDSTAVPRSGNPGYIIGEPVLAGFLVDSNTMITFDSGRGSVLTILSPTLNGECESRNRQTVKFGENVISSCNLSSAAASINCFFSTPLSLITALDDSLNESARIASFGNSTPDSAGDWMPLLRDEPPSWTHCNGFTVTLEILYAKLGSLANPQNRIVGGKLKFETQRLYSETGLPLHTNLFSLTTIVSFLDVSSSTDSDVAPTGLTGRDYIVFGVLGGVAVLLFLARVLDSK